MIAVVATGLCLLVFALGLARGEPPEVMGVTAISLAVAAVPESLPAVVTWPWRSAPAGWPPGRPWCAGSRPSRPSARSPSWRPTRPAP
ncbi:hypothetical protein [Kitasatospora albolonga]|uniref:hypothetical protein n=1 Tax=Kitasatospora albolonga TaxID=68173 RepID=UPI0031E92EFF